MHKLTLILLVIGGLNWLIFGLSGWEVGMLFGEMNNMVARIIYVLVGLSALFQLFTMGKMKKSAKPMGTNMGSNM